MNYYRRYAGDYLRDTARLSLLEHGAYSLMLDYYYSDEQPLPAEHERIYLLVRAMRPEEQAAVDTVLRLYFVLKKDGYHQKRADKEIEVAKTARENGGAGGRPKGGKKTGGREKASTRVPGKYRIDHETGEITGLETETETQLETQLETGLETQSETETVTQKETESRHPPTASHQPPTRDRQAGGDPGKEGTLVPRSTDGTVVPLGTRVEAGRG